jgi:hypothetical protein
MGSFRSFITKPAIDGVLCEFTFPGRNPFCVPEWLENEAAINSIGRHLDNEGFANTLANS